MIDGRSAAMLLDDLMIMMKRRLKRVFESPSLTSNRGPTSGLVDAIAPLASSANLVYSWERLLASVPSSPTLLLALVT